MRWIKVQACVLGQPRTFGQLANQIPGRQRHQQEKVVCTLKLPWLSNLREMPCLLA